MRYNRALRLEVIFAALASAVCLLLGCGISSRNISVSHSSVPSREDWMRKEVSANIENLAAEEYRVREEARNRLLSIGFPALRQLKETMQDENTDIHQKHMAREIYLSIMKQVSDFRPLYCFKIDKDEECCSIAVSSDGTKVAADSKKGPVKVWNLADGALIYDSTKENGEPADKELCGSYFFFAPGDNSLVAIRDERPSVAIKLDLATLQRTLRKELPCHWPRKFNFTISTEKNRIALIDDSNDSVEPDPPTLLKVFGTKTFELVQTVGIEAVPTALALSPCGRTVAATVTSFAPETEEAILHHKVFVWDVHTGREVLSAVASSCFQSRAEAVCLDKGRKTAAIMVSWPHVLTPTLVPKQPPDSRDKVILYDLRTGKQSHVKEASPGRQFEGISFSPCGTLLAVREDTGGLDTFVSVLDTATGRNVFELSFTELGECIVDEDICWSPDGSLLAVGTFIDVIALFDTATGCQVGKLKLLHPREFASPLLFTPDGRMLVFQTERGVEVWQAQHLPGNSSK